MLRRAGLITVLVAVLLGGSAVVLSRFVVISMPGASHRGPLPPLTAAQRELAARLQSDVTLLAGDIGERNLFRRGTLERAAAHIERSFEEAGLEVASQVFEVRGRPVRNVEAVIPGTDPESGIVVVGAHYDSAPGSPGANDNASGVAALLALGRSLQGRNFSRSIRLAAFVNEEAPYSFTEAMGSVRYAERLAQRREKIGRAHV